LVPREERRHLFNRWLVGTCVRLEEEKLTPAYINIRIKGTNQQCQRSLRIAKHYRINQEIKLLYTKKIKLNEQLYKLHHECANKWPSTWPIISQNTDQMLTHEMETHCNSLNQKLDKLQNEQHRNKTNNNHQRNHFYPRTVNLTKIKFTTT
jgi:hypothetical protein